MMENKIGTCDSPTTATDFVMCPPPPSGHRHKRRLSYDGVVTRLEDLFVPALEEGETTTVNPLKRRRRSDDASAIVSCSRMKTGGKSEFLPTLDPRWSDHPLSSNGTEAPSCNCFSRLPFRSRVLFQLS